MNKAVRGAFCLFAALATSVASAERTVGFGMDAFNRVYPASYAKNFVFSPAAFEIDGAIIAESLDVKEKGDVTERIGAVLGLPITYKPMLEAFASDTNGVKTLSARGFTIRAREKLSSDSRKKFAAFRLGLENDYGVEVMPCDPPEGAGGWFRATMEGAMEDFAPAKPQVHDRRYCFYDLENVSLVWREGFSEENIREYVFHSASKPKVKCLTGVRIVDIRETPAFTVVRLPLAGKAWFYAIMPKKGHTLGEIREALTSERIDEFLAIMSSGMEFDVKREPCAIALPMFTIDTSANLLPVFKYFGIPTSGLVNVDPDAAPREVRQRTRFTLSAEGGAPAEIGGEVKRKMLFVHPFLFFVHHEPTRTIPIAGQYCGEE